MESFPVLEGGKSGLHTEKAIAGVFDNFLDKEKRKLNIVIHNIPEPSGHTYAERVEQDKATFKEMVKDAMHLSVNVTRAYRVGRPANDKPRLLIISLENAEVKVDVLKLAPQLRAIEEWKNVYITPDLTWKEREEGRRLREELRRRTSEGEQNLIIRRGRVVKRRVDDDPNQPNPTRVPAVEDHEQARRTGEPLMGRRQPNPTQAPAEDEHERAQQTGETPNRQGQC